MSNRPFLQDQGYPNGRIYVFEDSHSALKTILPPTPEVKVENERARDFLRHHFQHCLFTRIFGEDVKHNPETMFENVEPMLVEHPTESLCIGRPESPRWNTPLGFALWEWAVERCDLKKKERLDDEYQ